MNGELRIAITNRRELLIGAGAAATLLALAGQSMAADPADKAAPAPRSLFDQAVEQITRGTKPVAGSIVLELPEIAENGNTVPYAITIASPMTEAEHVKAIHVLSTANPLPNIASFYLTPLAGKAAVASRMRLAKTQDVIILAEQSDGRFLIAKQAVKVTIGGCGG